MTKQDIIDYINLYKNENNYLQLISTDVATNKKPDVRNIIGSKEDTITLITEYYDDNLVTLNHNQELYKIKSYKMSDT